MAWLTGLISGHRLTVLRRILRRLIGLLLSLSRLTQTLGGLGDFFTDAAWDRGLRRPIPFSGGLSLLSRLLQVLGSLLGRLSGLVRVALLRLLLSGLHVLLTVRRLLTGLSRSLGGLLLIERLLSEPLLRFGQLLPQLLRGVVQFLLTLLLRGVRSLRLLTELFHLLRDRLLPLGQFVRLLREFGVRTRVVLQLFGELLSGFGRLLATLGRLRELSILRSLLTGLSLLSRLLRLSSFRSLTPQLLLDLSLKFLSLSREFSLRGLWLLILSRLLSIRWLLLIWW